ncbi:hypothetical protein AVEN_147389-1 [Araneus ventricosus]|uniref:RNase H type-1 domain-containing protein n=1 Tax=Araneus ventricosus TaxID=182803 RepID=A0A4Y2FS90_ARAVE|nr:hypothetical protein AVEN_147389-1 [Araneus ventricosus]
MASKPDPLTQASMTKALNVSQQVNSAPSLASRVTQKFLTDQQVQFPRPQQWMPNSSDTSPCDYFLWGHPKNNLNKRRVSTLRGLQKALREEAIWFREGRSVDTALESLLSKIKEARTSEKHGIVLSIDIKGAFDNLHHEAIIKALGKSPCPANILKVYINLLKNRKVSIQSLSGPIIKPQAKGCPQGSCSGPALWNLVANSALNIKWPDEVHIQAFADDFAMVIKAPTEEKLKQVAQKAIDTFNTWCEVNHLDVAPDKTQFILFSKMVAPPRITWEGVKIKKLQSEARFVTLTRLQRALPSSIVNLEPNQIETKVSGWASHPSHFLQTSQISLEDGGPDSIKNLKMIQIFTDGSKSGEGVGAVFCVLHNNILLYEWKGQLSKKNTVFQAELSALKEATVYAVESHKNQWVKIFADNQASIKAISNPKSKSSIARFIFTLLLSNPNIHISWIKAHADYPGNEKADSLAKEAITSGCPYNILLPVSYVKSHLRQLMIRDWQNTWKNGKTGRLVNKLLPTVSLHSQIWPRELTIFFTEHGPFPTFLKRFRLSQHDFCNCGAVGSPMHYATECILTLSYHLRTPLPAHYIPWCKSIIENKTLRIKTCDIIQFIHKNNDIFKIN